MPTTQMLRLAALIPMTAAMAACLDLSGPGLDSNPNSPSKATANQLLASVQGFGMAQLTGDYNRLASVYVQHMAGAGRQWLTLDAPYLNDEGSFGTWNGYYTGGGLIDIRGLQSQARTAGDRVYLGIGQVLEALFVGTLADFWGDIPYREALGGSTTPRLDPQLQVYGDIQVLLDSAIANLSSGTGAGPGAVDLIYGGDASSWRRAANTLKARYFLHAARTRNGDYALAAAAAAQGIQSSAGDLRTYQSANVGEENQWFQFRRGRGTDIAAGQFIVNLMQGRGDPRLTQYFGPSGQGPIRGVPPNTEDETASWLSATRGAAGFRQPLVTWAENQLILAEAQVRSGSGTPLALLNAVRTAAGYTTPLTGLTGNALLEEILLEKYIALFQNPEAWSDYRRTCIPNLQLFNGAVRIPTRFIYGADERQTNSNVPSPNAVPRYMTAFPRNTTTPTGAVCAGQQP